MPLRAFIAIMSADVKTQGEILWHELQGQIRRLSMHYKQQVDYMQRLFGNNCKGHQDRAATGYCAFCGGPVCDECHDGTYCRTCIEEPPKKKSTALLLAVFLVWLGVHRFYMGFWFTGMIYLLSLGLFGIGWAIDIIRILLFSTVKKEQTYSVGENLKDAISETIMDSVSSGTSHILKYRLPWRDKFGRPLLPLGCKSLEKKVAKEQAVQ
jgi:TM2 domain-containing membrane protein YozV